MGLAAGAAAAQPASPDVEVKFLLNPAKVLGADYQPIEAVRKAFQVAPQPVAIAMLFLDGAKRQLDHAGWFIRLRKFRGHDHIELTFKRRYRVERDLQATLDKAARQGFDATQNVFASEVDWTYGSRTLTFADERRAGTAAAQSLTLPAAGPAARLAVEMMPAGLRRLKYDGWAEQVLSGARAYGPMEGRRWRGRRPGIDGAIDIEVWTLPADCHAGMRPMVEISFKAKQYGPKAIAERTALMHLLERRGWLLKKDELKTRRILQCAGTTRDSGAGAKLTASGLRSPCPVIFRSPPDCGFLQHRAQAGLATRPMRL